MKTYEMNMCSGPLFPKITRFLVPLIFSGLLQLLFTAADMMVVGHFSGSNALAAVGATTFLVNLQVNLFTGISVGANVITAQYFGAKDERGVFESVHTSIALALVGGLLMILLGNLIARPVLIWMGTPDTLLSQAVLYIRIYFLGMPALMLYNFGAAILRTIGDTKRPLYFLTLAGIINVLFNLLFVIVFHLGVAGVAIATVISQTLSAYLVLYCLCKSNGCYKLYILRLHIYTSKAIMILKIGLSAGFQSVLFNIANILVQSSVNTFGSLVIAGNTAANNIERFVYVTINSTSQTAISFIGQNMGARQYQRVRQIYWECLAIIGILSTALGIAAYLFGPQLLRLYTSEEEVIAYGLTRLSIVAVSYGLNGLQDVMASSLRGMGLQVIPTAISLIGICLVRILWVLIIFPIQHSRIILYLAYPISWSITIVMNLICYKFIIKKQFSH